MNQCPLCSSSHGEIYQRFTKYVIPESIGNKECREFIKAIKFEIQENNWTEAYCLVSNIVRRPRFYSQENTYSNLFWQICVNVEEIMRKNPGIGAMEKIESLNKIIVQSESLPEFVKRVKEELSEEQINQEFESLKTTAQNLDSNLEIEQQLKNYFHLRMVSFYERIMHDVLVKEINQLPKDNLYSIFGDEVRIKTTDLTKLDELTVGRLALLGMDNAPESLNKIIVNMLKTKYGDKKINSEFRFLTLIDDTMKFSEGHLKREYDKFGGWYKIIKGLNRKRNQLTHELTNTDLGKEEIIILLAMFQKFFKIFTGILKLIIHFKDESKTTEEKRQNYNALRDNNYDSKKGPTYELIPFDEFCQKIKFAFISKNFENNRR